MTARIAVIEGDGIGREVIPAAVSVLSALSLGLDFAAVDAGAERFLATGEALRPGAFGELAAADAILLGAIGDPRIRDPAYTAQTLGRIRGELDLYANVRPARLLDRRLSPLRDPPLFDLIVLRENTEGLYTTLGGRLRPGTAAEVAVQEHVSTYHGVARIIGYAFAIARSGVVMADKPNAMPHAGALWHRCWQEARAAHPRMPARHLAIDACALHLIAAPARFDVIVTEVRGKVAALQLKREHRRWYAIVIVETQPVLLPAAGREAGVDMGVARFLTTSDGQVIASPRFLAASAAVIADLERRKTRTRPGSGNRKRIRRALAREWRTQRNRRRDFHHQTARMLIREYDAIALEKLNTAGMPRRPAAKPDPQRPGEFLPNQAAAKAGLNKSILDAGWAQFASILSGKAEEAGRRVILVNPAFTSIDCHACGSRCTRPRQDTVICPRCGPLDADLNGARNIATRAGLGSGQATHAA